MPTIVSSTVTRSIALSSGSGSISGYSTAAGSSLTNVSAQFAAGSVNAPLTIAFPFATLQQIFLVSDKGMTIKFNSSSSPVPTLVLQPGSPFEWNAGDGYFANIFTANITTAFVTCTPASRLGGYYLVT
jgi:hypothetical protein